MGLTEKKEINLIEIVNNNIQVREELIIEKDGLEIAKNFHRYVLCPGDDLSKESDKIKSIAAVIWTQEIVEAYKQKKPSIVPEPSVNILRSIENPQTGSV
jgi:hypothetical protein